MVAGCWQPCASLPFPHAHTCLIPQPPAFPCPHLSCLQAGRKDSRLPPPSPSTCHPCHAHALPQPHHAFLAYAFPYAYPFFLATCPSPCNRKGPGHSCLPLTFPCLPPAQQQRLPAIACACLCLPPPYFPEPCLCLAGRDMPSATAPCPTGQAGLPTAPSFFFACLCLPAPCLPTQEAVPLLASLCLPHAMPACLLRRLPCCTPCISYYLCLHGICWHATHLCLDWLATCLPHKQA